MTEVMLPILKVVPGPKRESLSVPFQQTARYVQKYGDEVTDGEREAIDAVVDYHILSTKYDEGLSDPVKDTYRIANADNESELLKRYFKAWFAMLQKHPLVYAEAFIANTSGYYALLPQRFANGDTSNHGMNFRLGIEYNTVYSTSAFDFAMPASLAGVRDTLENWANLFGNLPLLNLLYVCAFYTWLVLGCFGYQLHKRSKRAVLFMLIPMMTLVGCLASPVNNCFRYYLPIAALTPLLLAACFQKEADGEAAHIEERFER